MDTVKAGYSITYAKLNSREHMAGGRIPGARAGGSSRGRGAARLVFDLRRHACPSHLNPRNHRSGSISTEFYAGMPSPAIIRFPWGDMSGRPIQHLLPWEAA